MWRPLMTEAAGPLPVATRHLTLAHQDVSFICFGCHLTLEYRWHLNFLDTRHSLHQPYTPLVQDILRPMSNVSYPAGRYSYDTVGDPEKTKSLDSLRTHYSASALAAFARYWQWGFRRSFDPINSDQLHQIKGRRAQAKMYRAFTDRNRYGSIWS